MNPPRPTTSDRVPSEYADAMPRMYEMAALPADDPHRARLRGDLVVVFLPVVEKLAHRHSAGRREAFDDLRQVGTIALITAIDRWDPHRATGEFLGYMIPCVRGEMLRWFRDRTWSVRVPRRLKELSASISRVMEPLAQELGRAPRPSELAARLGTDVQEVIDALGAADSRNARSLDAEETFGGTAPAERWGAPDAAYDMVDNRDALRQLLAALPERDRTILALRFVDELTQTQIAQRIGMSQMHVSRLLARVLARLRRALVDQPATDPATASSVPHTVRELLATAGV